MGRTISEAGGAAGESDAILKRMEQLLRSAKDKRVGPLISAGASDSCVHMLTLSTVAAYIQFADSTTRDTVSHLR